MNINPDVVRIKSEVKKASKQKFRIQSPDNKKRAKGAQHDKHSFFLALETGVPVGEAKIRGGFELNMEEHRSSRT
jgi:hypothetical protein